MASSDRLLQLFHAFRERNDEAFRRAAEAIIADELSGNRHALARDLQKALGLGRNGAQRPGEIREFLGKVPVADGLLLAEVGPDELHVVFGDETKRQISRVIEEQRASLLLAEHGYLPKSRLLFWGPPGCGKTLTARYLAQQLGLPLGVLQLSATISTYLGETASRLQLVFNAAAQVPMLLFLDEVDAIAKARDDRNDIGELKRVVNSLLQALDAFKAPRSVLVAASNHQYLLDEAVWRRFDAVINFPLPGPAERLKLLERLLSGIRLTGALTPAVKASDSLSFADIDRAVTEAVKTMILASRTELSVKDVVAEINVLKSTVTQARQRIPRSNSES